jgi:hypothetical protein
MKTVEFFLREKKEKNDGGFWGDYSRDAMNSRPGLNR